MADANDRYGLLAEFEDVTAIYKAAQRVRDEGYKNWDVFSPFPIHNMDEAMGLGRPKVSLFMGTGALCGVSGALLMQWWMNAVDYQILNGGKPLFAWEQATPVTFELGVLLSAFGCLGGMLLLNKLPMPYHPLFKKDNFLRSSDDKFFIAIESKDPKFDESSTKGFLESLGGFNIETVEA